MEEGRPASNYESVYFHAVADEQIGPQNPKSLFDAG